MSNFAYYDREADIVWLPVGNSADIRGDEQPWGLISRDRDSGDVESIEIWSASEVLPSWLLDNLPSPGRESSS